MIHIIYNFLQKLFGRLWVIGGEKLKIANFKSFKDGWNNMRLIRYCLLNCKYLLHFNYKKTNQKKKRS